MNSAAGLELCASAPHDWARLTRADDSYEGDLKQLLESIAAKLDGPEAREGQVEARKATLRRVMMEAEEADEVVAQMELELQGHASKAKLQVKLRGYKAELQRRKADVRSLTASLDRHDLLGGPGRSGAADAADDGSGLSQAQAQRARLLAGTDKLSDGQRRLEDSHRIALETESLGTGILGNLRSQREQLENTRDTLHGADSSIGKASDTLQKMLRRSVRWPLARRSVLSSWF